ncbi:MAG: hypothetical protein LBE08_11445 [Bifidobacteriaceae bacterium]|jgi:hypothetical protein|nr:hypothetical protein [Bifidobacteriaceae bacterium]
MIRATVPLKEPSYREIKRIAALEHRSVSSLLTALVEEGLSRCGQAHVVRSPKTGLPVFQLPGLVSATEAAALADEDA